MSTTTITIRTSEDTKKKAQELFSDLGMDMSTAVNVFLRKAVKEERIPFEIGKNMEQPNRQTIMAMKRVEAGKDLVGPFRTVEEAMNYLDA